MMYGRPQTEQPQENQSSFGPSNQQSSFAGNQPQNQYQQAGNMQGFNTATGKGWANPAANVGSTMTLPWQKNDMSAQGPPVGNQQSFSQPQQEVQQQPAQPAAPSPNQWNVGHNAATPEGMNREQWRDAWMGSGTSNNQGLDQWLQQHGGQRLNDSGLTRTPFGETLDLGIGFKSGSGQPGFTDVGAPQGGLMPQGSQASNPQAAVQGLQNATQQFGFGPSSFGPSQTLSPGQQFGGQNPQMNPQQNQQMFQLLGQLMNARNGSVPQSQGAGVALARPDLYQTANNNTMDISGLTQSAMGQYGPTNFDTGML